MAEETLPRSVVFDEMMMLDQARAIALAGIQKADNEERSFRGLLTLIDLMAPEVELSFDSLNQELINKALTSVQNACALSLNAACNSTPPNQLMFALNTVLELAEHAIEQGLYFAQKHPELAQQQGAVA